METLLPLIIQAVSGAAGGNIIAQVLKNLDLGPVGNTIAGAIGGAGGGQLLGTLLSSGALAGTIGQIAGGGIGGIVLTAIAGFIKNAMNK